MISYCCTLDFNLKQSYLNILLKLSKSSWLIIAYKICKVWALPSFSPWQYSLSSLTIFNTGCSLTLHLCTYYSSNYHLPGLFPWLFHIVDFFLSFEPQLKYHLFWLLFKKQSSPCRFQPELSSITLHLFSSCNLKYKESFCLLVSLPSYLFPYPGMKALKEKLHPQSLEQWLAHRRWFLAQVNFS